MNRRFLGLAALLMLLAAGLAPASTQAATPGQTVRIDGGQFA
jgi:hypothetical protein